jgi:predicted DNA binding protein
MTLPDDAWISEVSREHPEATFRLLTGLATDEQAIELGEIVGKNVEAAAEAVETHPAVEEYESLFRGSDRSLARYTTEKSGLYAFLRDASLPPEYPIVVEDGRFEFEMTASREQFEAIRDGLDAAGFDYELLSLVGSETPAGLLTDRQREVLDTAIQLGYFEVPRECTLAEVAAELGIDKSTASGILRRGEGLVVKWFRTGETPENGP